MNYKEMGTLSFLPKTNSGWPSSRPRTRSELAKYGSLLIIIIALLGNADARCSSCSSGGGGEGVWDGPAWIESVLNGSSEEAVSAGIESGAGIDEVSDAEALTEDETDSYGVISSITSKELKERLDGNSKPAIAYVSNTPIQGSYIEGSIALPSKSLIQGDGSLKAVSDLAALLGNAGITEKDDLVIYGGCFSCGDATFVYWIMKCLGHQNVQMLEGRTGDWDAAGLPRSAALTTKPAVTYSPHPATDLLADYEAVAGGEFQVVDARAADQFAEGHIDGAINIDYNRVIENDWIKDSSALAEIFVDLKKDRPVAVYTKNGGQASIVWYALVHQGYDASLYTWNDWLRHQS